MVEKTGIRRPKKREFVMRFLPSPRPLPLARFVNPQPGPDLAARIEDGDLITNSAFFGLRIPVFFDHSTACVQATSLAF